MTSTARYHDDAAGTPASAPVFTSILPIFPSILCGVDGSRPSYEAARQAALLAVDGAALTYLAVTWESGFGRTATAQLSHRHAAEALAHVRDMARELGVTSEIVDASGEHAADLLTREARRHDLLVVGTHSRTRVGGILVGTTSSTVLHRSPGPVLVARRPPGDDDVPASILLAVDGTPAAHAAAALTARLARHHGSMVAIIAPPDRDAAQRHALAADAAEIRTATGHEPVLLDEHGPAHKAVAAAADELGASLVVTGSRGLTGVKALRSVSERIAHAALCSVLVVRPRSENA